METQTKISTFSSEQLQPEKTTSTILNPSNLGKVHEIRVNHIIEEEQVVTEGDRRWFFIYGAHPRKIKFFAFCCPVTLLIFLLLLLGILVLNGIIHLS